MSRYATMFSAGVMDDGSAPWIYEGSNRMPAEHGGSVEVAELVGDLFVRVWVTARKPADATRAFDGSVAVLGEAQVRELRDALSEWLDRA